MEDDKEPKPPDQSVGTEGVQDKKVLAQNMQVAKVADPPPHPKLLQWYCSCNCNPPK